MAQEMGSSEKCNSNSEEVVPKGALEETPLTNLH